MPIGRFGREQPASDSWKYFEFEYEIIHPGEMLLYSNEGITILTRFQDVFVDPQGVLRIKLLCTSGKEVVTTQQSVRSPDNPDIGWVPASVPDLRKTSSLQLLIRKKTGVLRRSGTEVGIHPISGLSGDRTDC